MCWGNGCCIWYIRLERSLRYRNVSHEFRNSYHHYLVFSLPSHAPQFCSFQDLFPGCYPRSREDGFYQCNKLFTYVKLYLTDWDHSSVTLGNNRKRTLCHVQNPIRRLVMRYRKVSKPRDLYLEWSDCSEISKRCEHFTPRSHVFESVRDLTIRRLIGYRNRAQTILTQSQLTVAVWRAKLSIIAHRVAEQRDACISF